MTPHNDWAFLASHSFNFRPLSGMDGARYDHDDDPNTPPIVISLYPDPDEIPESSLNSADLQDGQIGIAKLLVSLGLAKSNNEARQKVQEGAVTIGPDRTKIADPKASVAVSDGLIVRLGSRRIVRVRMA